MAYFGFDDPTKPTQDVTPLMNPQMGAPYAQPRAAAVPAAAAPPAVQPAPLSPEEQPPLGAGLAAPRQIFGQGGMLHQFANRPPAPPITVATSEAPRAAIPGSGPAGPISGYGRTSNEGGLNAVGRGYPAGAIERAANEAPLTGQEGVVAPGGFVGSASIQAGPGGTLGTPAVAAQSRQYTQDDLTRMSAGGNPAALAEVKAQYAAMRAGEKADDQQAIARRDASIAQNIEFARNYRGGMNAFDRANEERVARITARGRETFGPNYGAVRAVGAVLGRDAERERAGRAGASTELSTRDYFKEAATGQDMAAAARKNVTAEKTAGVDLAGKQTDVQGKQLDVKTKEMGLEEQKKMAALRDKIDKMEPGKAKDAALEQYRAFLGKAGTPEKFAIIEVPSGGTDPMTGRPHTIKQAVNVHTGEILGGNAQGAAAAGKPYANVEEAHAQARKAITEGGLSPAEVNKRLKAAGYAELK